MALDKFQPYLFVSAGEQSNKYLTPVVSPDGIASFQAQRVQSLTGLTVRIDPIQEGSGDPSPTNIRPISGRTGLTITRAGRNLLKIPYAEDTKTQNGITFTVNADGSIRVTGTATGTATLILANTAALNELPFLGRDATLALSGCPSGGSSTTYYMTANFAGDNTGDVGASNLLDIGVGDTKYYTNARVKSGGNLFIRVMSGTTIDKVFYPMLELADSVTEWQSPTVAQTIPITWESIAGTVYGGTLDVVSGVLTVDWDYIASYDGETLPGEWISDRDVYEEGTTPTAGAEVAYKLAEPVTYQLTPTYIKTLAGFNQIYSDAGPIIDIKF